MFNHGGTITIKLPKGFKYDAEASAKDKSAPGALKFLTDQGATFKQDGDTLTITIPQAVEGKMYTHNTGSDGENQLTEIPIVGQYTGKLTDQEQDLTNGDLANAVTFKFNDGNETKTLTTKGFTAMFPSHYEGKPVNFGWGDIFTLTPYGPFDNDVDNNAPFIDYTNHEFDASNTDPSNFYEVGHVDVSMDSYSDFNNLHTIVDVPDGYDVYQVDLDRTAPDKTTITLTGINGTKKTIDYNGGRVSLPNNERITNIDVCYPTVKAQIGNLPDVGLFGHLDTHYKNGNTVNPNDIISLNARLAIDDDVFGGRGRKIEVVTPKKPTTKVTETLANAFFQAQLSSNPGATSTSEMRADFTSFRDEDNDPSKVKLVFTIPNGALISSIDSGNYQLAKSTEDTEGRKVLTFVPKAGMTVADLVQSPVTIELDNDPIILHTIEESSGDVTAYYDGQEESRSEEGWLLRAATVIYTTGLSQGNSNISPVINGVSDDHGNNLANLYDVIVNGDIQDLTNVVSIMHLPNKSDGQSKFNLSATNKAMALVNYKTGEPVNDGVTYLYTTDNIDLNNVTTTNRQEILSKFVPANQISDWSKVTNVAVEIKKLPKNTAYELELPVKDDTFADDLNKTAYTSSLSWADQLETFRVQPNEAGSASLTIKGVSVVNVRLHYKDAQGKDHYINVPKLAQSLKDGHDTLQPILKINKESNSGTILDNANASLKNQQLSYGSDTNLGKLYEAMPDGYAIDLENPTIINSDVVYPDNRPNGTAQFGKVSRYDFDQDIIQYELAPAIHKVLNVNRTIHYKNIKTGETMAPDAKQSGTIDVYASPFVKNGGYGLASSGKQVLTPAVKSPVIAHYNTDTPEVEGWNITSEVLSNLSDIDFNSDNPSWQGKDVTVWYDQNAAELLILNTNPALAQPLSSSIVYGQNAGDPIVFKTTDQQLQKKGYTYKVYYSPSQVSGSSLLPDQIDTMGYTKYSTLADALKANGKYDDLSDVTYNNWNEGIESPSQVFIVAYTPTDQLTDLQRAAIVAENDPWTNSKDPLKRAVAIGSSIDQDKQSLLKDYLIAAGKTGTPLFTPVKDTKGNIIPGTQLADQVGLSGVLSSSRSIDMTKNAALAKKLGINTENFSSLYLYPRAGYVIDKVTYQVMGNDGKPINLVFQGIPSTSASDSEYSKYTSGHFKKVDDHNYTTYVPADGSILDMMSSALNEYMLADNGAPVTGLYDNTQYDSKTGEDPQPQLLILHYAKNPYMASIQRQIYYVDVTGLNPMKSGQYEYGKGVDLNGKEVDGKPVNFDTGSPAYKQYLKDNGVKSIVFGRNASVSLNDNDAYYSFSYDDTLDGYWNQYNNGPVNQMIPKGYVVVQSDKEAKDGYQEAGFETDAETGQYDGNTAEQLLQDGGLAYATQNYYVYLKQVNSLQQNAQLTVIDDSDPKNQQTLFTSQAQGLSGSQITFAGATKAVDQLINKDKYQFEKATQDGKTLNVKGYSDIKFGNFDNNDKTTQSWVVYLTKKSQPVVHEQNAQLTVIDDTNGQTIYQSNVPGQPGTAINFVGADNFINNYQKNGYQFEKATQDGKALNVKSYGDIKFGNFDNDDKTTQSWVVYLTKKSQPVVHEQNAQLTVIDDSNNQTIYSSPIEGMPNTAIQFTGADSLINSYLKNHYQLGKVFQDGKPLSVTKYGDIKFGNFDNNDKTTQSWIIHLTKAPTPVVNEQNAQLTVINDSNHQILYNAAVQGKPATAISFL